MGQRPELKLELCNGCGLCVLVCQTGGLVMDNSHIKAIETVECDYCGECEMVCASGAINLVYQIVRV